MSFNITIATKRQLLTVKGMGEKLAERVLFFQEKVGFDSLDDILQVPGIGPKVLREMRKMKVSFIPLEDRPGIRSVQDQRRLEDIRTLHRSIFHSYKMGKISKGREWTSQEVKKHETMWEAYHGNMDLFNTVKETAKETFRLWELDEAVGEYRRHEYLMYDKDCVSKLEDDKELEDDAWDQAWWLMNQKGWDIPRLTLFQRDILDELVEGERTDPTDLDDEESWKLKLSFRRYVGAIEALRDKEMETTRKKKIESFSRNHPIRGEYKKVSSINQLAARLHRQAGFVLFEEERDSWSEEASERTASADEQQDKVNGMSGDISDLVQTEMWEGKTKGLIDRKVEKEPNWDHMKWMAREGEKEFHQWMEVMVRCRDISILLQKEKPKNNAALVFKTLNHQIWDMYTDKEGKRPLLQMMGSRMAFMTKEHYGELSRFCRDAVAKIRPRWKYLPAAIQPYSRHMSQQGKAPEAREKVLAREAGDLFAKEKREEESARNMVDLGRMDEDDGWMPTEVADMEGETPEQMAMVYETFSEE